jgi:predicted DNA binding CopG/RHH family protein
MEVRPGHTPTTTQRTGRGSGSGLRKQRRDALGPRKDIIVRLPEEVARQLKVVAACEGMTIQDFCEEAIMPQIRKAMEKHGLSPEQIAR